MKDVSQSLLDRRTWVLTGLIHSFEWDFGTGQLVEITYNRHPFRGLCSIGMPLIIPMPSILLTSHLGGEGARTGLLLSAFVSIYVSVISAGSTLDRGTAVCDFQFGQ